jgi:hypothetical protein
MGPDEKVFRTHIERGPFQNGVDRQKWRLLSIDWPHVLIAISAVAREGTPSAYTFRFECSNYPQSAPTARPWDNDKNMPLEHKRWPTGRSRVPLAFNPGWNNGQCLYLPCDRLALAGHSQWPTQYPSMIWSSTSDITFYLRIIYDLLNSSDYTGTRSA